MSNTYSQINIHLIFAVKGRQNVLNSSLRPTLFRYISGILKELEQYPLAVNGYLDHVHVFFELNPKSSISEICRITKASTSKWVNENNYIAGKFEWQKGYGAFSYSRSQRNQVIEYILKQEEHHKQKTFREEYLDLLRTFGVNYNEKYLFEWLD